jgi:hypothetical protein
MEESPHSTWQGYLPPAFLLIQAQGQGQQCHAYAEFHHALKESRCCDILSLHYGTTEHPATKGETCNFR